MRLSSIKNGERFFYSGKVYKIDQYGSYGNRQIPVVGVETGEKLRLPVNTEVEITESVDVVIEPKVEEVVELEQEPSFEELEEPDVPDVIGGIPLPEELQAEDDDTPF